MTMIELCGGWLDGQQVDCPSQPPPIWEVSRLPPGQGLQLNPGDPIRLDSTTLVYRLDDQPGPDGVWRYRLTQKIYPTPQDGT